MRSPASVIPERFFATLRKLGIGADQIALDDHHRFSPGDLSFDDDVPVVMTEKDATKVMWMTQDDVPAQCWYLEIDVTLSERAEAALAECLTTRGIAAERSKTRGGAVSDGPDLFGRDPGALRHRHGCRASRSPTSRGYR